MIDDPFEKGWRMSDTAMATLFIHEGRQAVELPDEFRLPGTEVRVTRSGDGLCLEPVRKTMSPGEVRAILAQMDRIGGDPIFPNGREQLSMPDDDDVVTPDPPSIDQMRAGLARLDRYRHIPFMENGREQPPMPDDDDVPSLDP